MGLLTLFCGITVTFTGLASGAGVLPDSVNATVGETVMFPTSLAPAQIPFSVIIWAFGTSSIITSTAAANITSPEYKDRITLSISTGSLELRNVALSDAGEYSVTIIPEGSGAITGLTTLNIYEPVSNVRVTVSSSDLVESISSVTLSCSADGTNLTTFLWFNGSSEVTASDRVHLSDGGNNLTIVTVWRYDQGPFRCKVSNPVSNSTSDPEPLSVSYGPDNVTLKTSPNDHYEEGSDVSMSCSADSRPAAQFKWLLNGELLSFTGAQLELQNIQMNQSGNYSCQAFNSKTLRYTTSQPALISVLKNKPNPDPSPGGCGVGCIVGIVFGCIALALIVFGGVFYFLRRKKLEKESNTQRDGGGQNNGQDNSAYLQNQEMNYADVMFVKKGGGVVHMASQNQAESSRVQKSNSQPAPRLPTYNDHVTRGKRPAPQPLTTGTEYAEIRRK